MKLFQLVNLNRDLTIKSVVATWEARSFGGETASTDENLSAKSLSFWILSLMTTWLLILNDLVPAMLT